MMKVDIPDGLINDSVYICEQCEATVMCFTDMGQIDFCPCCASRELKPKEEE